MTQVEDDHDSPDLGPENPPPLDSILEALISVVDHQGLSIGLTLATPAGLVSGEAISRVTWLRSLSGLLGEAPGGAAHALGNAFSGVADGWDKKKGPDDSGPFYIHLREAQYLVGESWVPTRGHLWRGRLGEVSGWYLGRVKN